MAKVKDMLIRFRPKGKRGGDTRSKEAKTKRDNVTNGKQATHGSNSRLYIEERLQRDHPEIWQEPSVRAY